MKILKPLTAAMAALFLLGGCAQGGDARSPGGVGGGITDIENCAVPVGALCVVGGDENDGALINALLDPNGPLGPIAGELNTEDLEAALVILLQNDGDLLEFVENLIVNGQLQEGLEALLLGGEDGQGGLADIIEALLLGNEDGGGLEGLLGESGIQGLVEALLIDPADPSCQAALGTICLISGDGDRQGVLDLLFTEDGALAGIDDDLSQDDLVAILANMLESDGSLANLVENLLIEGQLGEALEALLIGDQDDPISSGLIQALEGLLGPDVVDDLVNSISSLFGMDGENGSPLDDLIAALQELADSGDGEGGDFDFGPEELAELLDPEQAEALLNLLELLDPEQLSALAELLGDGGEGSTDTPLDDLIAVLQGLSDGGDELPLDDLEALLDPDQLEALLDLAELLDPSLLDQLLALLEGGSL